MSAIILKWLSGNDTGLSSKAIALVALGGDPADGAHRYPSDGADFGRCHRLLRLAPEARSGLAKLATEGGPYWAALVTRWEEIAAVYEAEIAGGARGATYGLMRSILDPIRYGPGGSMGLGR